jgi:hypothetical protein
LILAALYLPFESLFTVENKNSASLRSPGRVLGP